MVTVCRGRRSSQYSIIRFYSEEDWRNANPDLAKNSNVRDYATINELTVLSNLETHNAQMIREGEKQKKKDLLL